MSWQGISRQQVTGWLSYLHCTLRRSKWTSTYRSKARFPCVGLGISSVHASLHYLPTCVSEASLHTAFYSEKHRQQYISMNVACMWAFSVVPKRLLCLYCSIIEPLMMYCSTWYYPALSMSNRTRLLRISHFAAEIIRLPTPILSQMIDHAILKKARAVADESDHPLFTYFHDLPSRRRYHCIKCKTARYSRGFCACSN